MPLSETGPVRRMVCEASFEFGRGMVCFIFSRVLKIRYWGNKILSRDHIIVSCSKRYYFEGTRHYLATTTYYLEPRYDFEGARYYLKTTRYYFQVQRYCFLSDTRYHLETKNIILSEKILFWGKVIIKRQQNSIFSEKILFKRNKILSRGHKYYLER